MFWLSSILLSYKLKQIDEALQRHPFQPWHLATHQYEVTCHQLHKICATQDSTDIKRERMIVSSIPWTVPLRQAQLFVHFRGLLYMLYICIYIHIFAKHSKQAHQANHSKQGTTSKHSKQSTASKHSQQS